MPIDPTTAYIMLGVALVAIVVIWGMSLSYDREIDKVLRGEEKEAEQADE